MKSFSLYSEIEEDSEFTKEKEMLEDQLKINICFSKNVESDELINEIYKHCFSELYYFSCTYMQRPKLFLGLENLAEMEKINLECEKKIREHCVITALITVQHLLYKNDYITATRLDSDAKKSGHNYLLKHHDVENHELIYDNIKKDNKVAVERDEKSGKETEPSSDRNTINDIVQRFWERKNYNKKLSTYLSNIIDVKVEEKEYTSKSGKEKKTTSRRIPLVLSNFTYCILTNLKKFNIEYLLKKIENSESYKRNAKIRNFINRYIEFVNDISCDENNTTKVDKYLFYYVKERMFYSGFINYCFVKQYDENMNTPFFNEHFFESKLKYLSFKYEEDKFKFLNRKLSFKHKMEPDLINVVKRHSTIENLKMLMFLPNSLSRNYFINMWNSLGENILGEDVIYKFVNFTIPLFESTFFIVLYEYFKGKENDLKENALIKMNEILTNYVDKNMDDKINCNGKSQIEDLINNTVGQNENRATIYNIFDLLKHAFCNVDQKNIHINSNYRFEINEAISYLNNISKDESVESKFNKLEISNDYMQYVKDYINKDNDGVSCIRKF